MNALTLIGCGKAKRVPKTEQERALGFAARELYCGNLFLARRRYAEERGAPWFILSARHGLLTPDEMVAPYDATLTDTPWLDRCGWALTVASDLLAQMPDRAKRDVTVIELHAGAMYLDPLAEVLRALGFVVSLPVLGLQIGEQLAFYASNPAEAMT